MEQDAIGIARQTLELNIVPDHSHMLNQRQTWMLIDDEMLGLLEKMDLVLVEAHVIHNEAGDQICSECAIFVGDRCFCCLWDKNPKNKK